MKFGNTYLEDINICPHCHVVNQPDFKNHAHTTDLDGTGQLLTIGQCTNRNCLSHFPVLYDSDYNFLRFLDGLPKGPDWPVPIADLKSGKKEDKPEEGQEPIQTRFIKTYQEILVAEQELRELKEQITKNILEIKSKRSQVDDLYLDKVVIGGNTINKTKKKNLYNAFVLVFDDWNKQLESESDLTKKAEKSVNILKLLEKIISLANQDTIDLEKSLKGESDTAAIVKILGM